MNGCERCPAYEQLTRMGISMGRYDRVVALAGNPNTGKSTLFNALTGLRQHTGNWPGKTVTRAEGGFEFRDVRFKLVDRKSGLKRRAHMLLDHVFPEYPALFARPFAPTSRSLLRCAVTAQEFLTWPLADLTTTIRRASRGRLGKKRPKSSTPPRRPLSAFVRSTRSPSWKCCGFWTKWTFSTSSSRPWIRPSRLS